LTASEAHHMLLTVFLTCYFPNRRMFAMMRVGVLLQN
jgi:hypothetical protein